MSEQPWYASFWDCCSPAGTCFTACLFPCITYGKTKHRLRNNGDMSDHSCCNGACFTMYCASCFCIGCVPIAMQASDLREKHNLEGSCMGDWCKAMFCTCCHLVQQDKEAEYREGLMQGHKQQYQAQQGGMHYGRQ